MMRNKAVAAASKQQRKAIARSEVGSLKSDVRVFNVANPFYEPRHAGASGNPPKISVYVNIRESAVGVLYARGHIYKAQ